LPGRRGQEATELKKKGIKGLKGSKYQKEKKKATEECANAGQKPGQRTKKKGAGALRRNTRNGGVATKKQA